MAIEYEATFSPVNKDEIRGRLRLARANLVKPEFLQKRLNFYLPAGHEITGGWLRVRNEQDKITMSLKIIDGNKIKNQQEICLEINNYETGIKFLEAIGCQEKAYQESRRELWLLDGVEVTIDEWPYLEPYVEVEGKSEDEVRRISEKLSFTYDEAIFGAVDILYNRKYGLTPEQINNKIARITFDEPNPFLKINN
jgi:adenylate cyclase class 2